MNRSQKQILTPKESIAQIQNIEMIGQIKSQYLEDQIQKELMTAKMHGMANKECSCDAETCFGQIATSIYECFLSRLSGYSGVKKKETLRSTTAASLWPSRQYGGSTRIARKRNVQRQSVQSYGQCVQFVATRQQEFVCIRIVFV